MSAFTDMLAADVTTILQDELRLLLRGEVVWVKQRGAAGNCASGCLYNSSGATVVLPVATGAPGSARSPPEKTPMGCAPPAPDTTPVEAPDTTPVEAPQVQRRPREMVPAFLCDACMTPAVFCDACSKRHTSYVYSPCADW